MQINVSITKTATRVKTGPMQFDHVYDDGEKEWYVEHQQTYWFVDDEGNPVDGIQKFYIVKGRVKDSFLQKQAPSLWNALVTLWMYHENQIVEQEGLS